MLQILSRQIPLLWTWLCLGGRAAAWVASSTTDSSSIRKCSRRILTVDSQLQNRIIKIVHRANAEIRFVIDCFAFGCVLEISLRISPFIRGERLSSACLINPPNLIKRFDDCGSMSVVHCSKINRGACLEVANRVSQVVRQSGPILRHANRPIGPPLPLEPKHQSNFPLAFVNI